MKRQNKLVLLILAITLIFSSVLTACKEEELSSEDKKEREVVLEELREERNKIPEHVMVKEKYLDENDEIKGVVEYDYNDRGNIIEANYYNDEGDLIERREYKYNDEGLLVERKITDLEGTWRDYLWRNSSKARIDFNNKWGVQEEILFELQEGLTATYEYNDNQQLVTYESADTKGDKLRSIEIEYHPNYHKKSQKEKRFGGHIVESDYNKQGDLIKQIEDSSNYTRKEEFFYDENGNQIKNKNVKKDNSGEITEKTFTKRNYDNKGRTISGETTGVYYYGSGKRNIYSKRKYEYDEIGNRIKFIRKEDKDEIKEAYYYSYDEDGNRKSSIAENSEGEKMRNRNYSYKFDDMRNIVKRIKHDLLNDKIVKDKYEYDDNDNLISVKEKTMQGGVTKNKRYVYKKLNKGGNYFGEK